MREKWKLKFIYFNQTVFKLKKNEENEVRNVVRRSPLKGKIVKRYLIFHSFVCINQKVQFRLL